MQFIFEAYSRSLPYYYESFTGNNAKDDEFEESISGAWDAVTEKYSTDIIEATSADIIRYLNYYGVKPRDVDEFKLIYFMGCAFARFLEREGFILAAKVVQHGMVIMLDLGLRRYNGNVGRPELKERLTRIIRDQKVQEKLGADGIYLIYKCSANMLKEFSSSKLGHSL